MCTFINTFKSNYAFNVLSVSSSIYVYPLSFLPSKQFLYSLLNSIHAANTLMFVSIKFVVRSRFISFLEMYLNNIYNAYEDIRSSKFPSYIYWYMLLFKVKQRYLCHFITMKMKSKQFHSRVFFLDFEGFLDLTLFCSIFPFCGCPSYSSYEVFGLK